MKNIVVYNFCGEDVELELYRSAYFNGNIAVFCNIRSTQEPFAYITINTENKMPEGCNTVDVNDSEKLIQLILKEGFAELTGFTVSSGFCCYPVCKFNLDKIPEVE